MKTFAIERLGLNHYQDYWQLCKPKVVALLVFTAWVGMLLANPGQTPIDVFVFATLGIGLMASSAAALNHVVDRQIDAVMRRTQGRPLQKGNLDVSQCLVFASVIGITGFALLIAFVNFLTAALTFFSLVGYAFIYTMYLKRATPQNIVIGGLAGATPPLLGWTAVTNSIEAYPLILVLIIFTWTPPHFWALAIYRKEDYAKVDVPMLPVTHGEAYTRLQMLLYTVLLMVVSVVPFLLGENGLFYLAGALLLGAGFLYHVIMMMLTKSRQMAIKTFAFSIVYLMVLFAFLLVDRYLPLIYDWI